MSKDQTFAYTQTKKLLGEEFTQLLDIFEVNHPKSIRINTIRFTPSEYINRVLEKNIELKPIPFIPEGFFVIHVPKSSHSWWMRERLFGNHYGQGSASMIPPKILLPNKINPNIKVLDAAAAPGSKTTEMGAMMKNEGLLVANDRVSHRLYALHRNIQMMGITNAIVTQIDARYLGERWKNTFDYVLLDGPCSATGSNRKNPFANRQQQHYQSFQTYQKSILKSVLKTLKNEKSRLVYSTCSLLPIENEFVLAPFVEKGLIEIEPIKISGWKAHKGITEWEGIQLPAELENTLKIYPHENNSDAFFIAKIKPLNNKE